MKDTPTWPDVEWETENRELLEIRYTAHMVRTVPPGGGDPLAVLVEVPGWDTPLNPYLRDEMLATLGEACG